MCVFWLIGHQTQHERERLSLWWRARDEERRVPYLLSTGHLIRNLQYWRRKASNSISHFNLAAEDWKGTPGRCLQDYTVALHCWQVFFFSCEFREWAGRSAATVRGQCRRELGGNLAECHSFWFCIMERVIITSGESGFQYFEGHFPIGHFATHCHLKAGDLLNLSQHFEFLFNTNATNIWDKVQLEI